MLECVKVVCCVEVEKVVEVFGVYDFILFDLGDYLLWLIDDDKFCFVDVICVVQFVFMMSYL